MTDGFDGEKAAIIQHLIAAGDVARGIISATLREHDAPPSAGEALRLLATSDTPVTPRDMARHLGRDPSTATLTADRLEQAGLVERRPHPTDGRKRVLALTDHGRELWALLRDRLHESQLLERLTPADRRQLLELLTRMT